MRILIAGVDGYLGWPLAQRLASRGHEVAGVDNYSRRSWVEEMESWSATPICSMDERRDAFKERFGKDLHFWEGDLTDYSLVEKVFQEFQPEAIVHLGECPSAPYSMMDVHHATFVQTNNVVSTLNLLFAMHDLQPDAHLVKLGTMGEYGTPETDIPEGFFELEFRGKKQRMPFPRQAGSWYHWSKVHGSNNIMFASRNWGLRATDIMQGVVFGTRAEEGLEDSRFLTRLDFDQAFGTAINRFCCQAVTGNPLTPFGGGHQKRGFIPLRESMECLTIALENPADAGEYRVFNQFAEVYDVTQLALKVKNVAAEFGIDATIDNLENPRKELESHNYDPDHQNLKDLGYQPTQDVDAELRVMIQDLLKYKERITLKQDAFVPDVRWDGRREKVNFISSAEKLGTKS